ncbi:multidrug effflux MFS transporter [Pontixanthobacter aestiaquae]|uniref:Bcr/CflA family efflux transporter n=1 Tax=Pontixanthobacter aestiaquae TaxID=1509367 RepID=A0A844Z5L6_9SPHN|nr:multidrug effflux MFS transporter [Pontixanthobacter aestiaquae]MDN3646388.1 multidrug effflux MFS transporter [Pontixanthobacter aestiaquae]MXO82622.1 Bcr/CflA family efflux MFS transporter [Pontixanthobacter aestiaquae]
MATQAHRTKPALGEREMIVLMALLMSLQAFGIDAMLPALGQIAGEMGADGNDRQFVIGAYFLGAGAGALFPGAFADRYGRRPVLAVSLIAYIALSIACALATDYTMLLAFRLIQGFACAGLSVVPAAIVRDHVGGDRMARLMSLIMMIFLLVPILAPAVGQGILYLAGWRAIFGMMAVMGVLVGVWAWLRLPESLTEENRQDINLFPILRNMGTALTNRGAIGYVVGSALVFGSLFGFLNSSQQLIAETFDQGENFYLIFGGAVVGMVAANFTNSRIVERFGARRVGHAALLALIAISFAQLWSASQPQQPLYQFIILMSLSMASLGFIGANFSSIAMQPFYHIAGSASSAQTALRMSTGAVLGALIGSLYDGSAKPLAVSMLSCALVALAFVLFSERGKLFGRKVPSPD